MTEESSPGQPPEIDGSVPNSARIWNYWLGGKDNYPVDRQAGDQFRAVFPGIVEVARSSRRFLIRAVGAARWATSWVLSAVGRPVPMSRNCRMPASAAR